MYQMDLYELANAVKQKREMLAYKIWRLASFVRSPFVKDFPESPQKACPELYPKKKGIKMEGWILEKYMKGDR